MTQIDELFSRGVAQLVDPDGSFRKKVEAKMRGEYKADIVIKLGVDPTRPDIHLGHAVILRKLRAFQDIGCKVIFLIGDYTSQIGDPTGKSKVRPEISQAEIEKNMQTYLDQVGKILKTDSTVFSWIRNSDWFTEVTDIQPSNPAAIIRFNTGFFRADSFIGKAIIWMNTRMQKSVLKNNVIHTVSFSRVLATLRHITHARLIERDMFQERIKAGHELYMHEMLYPVIQGIDSSVLATIYGSCDLEIGGTDQTFNMLVGRDVMRMNKQPEQAVMSMDILEGLDGKEKMSKSLDNYVGITDEPSDMFGKIMSIPDTLIARYYTLATYESKDAVAEISKNLASGALHPKQAKMRLAHEIVSMHHGEIAAAAAENDFTETFSLGKAPKDVREISLLSTATLVDALIEAKCAASRGEARRLIEQGAVSNVETDEKLADPTMSVPAGTYRAGKHRFFKVK